MNQSKKRALIFAAVCIVLGFVISFSTAAVRDFDWVSLGTSISLNKNAKHIVSEAFENIRVESSSGDIHILPSSDGKCSIVGMEGEELVIQAEVQSKTLSVRRVDRRPWYNNIGFFVGRADDESITVYLPEESYKDLAISTASGDIHVSDAFQFDTAQVSSSSGELSFLAKVGGQLSLRSVSGDIRFTDSEAETLIVSSTSGDITLDRLTVEKLQAGSVSGEINLRKVTSNTLNVETTSGEVELENTLIAGDARVKTVSGDVELERFDAASLSVTTTSGEVEGVLLSAKNFQTRTTSGNVHVPASDLTGGSCAITTTSGDIEIKIK